MPLQPTIMATGHLLIRLRRGRRQHAKQHNDAKDRGETHAESSKPQRLRKTRVITRLLSVLEGASARSRAIVHLLATYGAGRG
jgi:hypothetical protein